MTKLSTTLLGMMIFSQSLLSQETIFFDSFESGSFDLTRWEPLPGDSDARLEVVQLNNRIDGFFGVIMGKTKAGVQNTNELRLYLDLSGHEQVRLEYWFLDFFDETDPFDAIYFSDDSAKTFTKVFQFGSSEWANNLWGKLPSLDVSGLARDFHLSITKNFVISFRQQGTGAVTSSGNQDGIIIDAVHVFDPKCSGS